VFTGIFSAECQVTSEGVLVGVLRSSLLNISVFLPSCRRYSPGWALASSTTSLHC